MKDYFKTIISTPKKWELVYWWVLRATMIFAIVDSLFGLGRYGFGLEQSVNIQQVLQSFANLVGMFAWEICMMFSKKKWPHYIPPHFQDGLIIILWLASFGGAYINFYYSINSYDYIMHVVLGAYSVIIGYEICTAIQKRDRKTADLSVVLLCAFGFSFIVATHSTGRSHWRFGRRKNLTIRALQSRGYLTPQAILQDFRKLRTAQRFIPPRRRSTMCVMP